jgi:hypothetical protein
MRSCVKSYILMSVLALAAAVTCRAQSLPEIARQQRQKQETPPEKTTKKVITNDDIPSSSDDAADSEDEGTQKRPDAAVHSKPGKSAAQWKKQILAQENVVASLQHEVGRLSASVHFVEVNRYSNGVQYNQYQARKQEEVVRLQKQLDSEKKKLSDMQESARRAGFGNAVYEP